MANFQFRGYKVKNVDFSLTNPTFQKFASLAKIPHFCLSNPEIENLSLIHLRIYKKIFFSGSNSKIFFFRQIENAKFGQKWLMTKWA